MNFNVVACLHGTVSMPPCTHLHIPTYLMPNRWYSGDKGYHLWYPLTGTIPTTIAALTKLTEL